MHENKELKEEINEIEPMLDKISGHNEVLTQKEKDSLISKMSKKLATQRDAKDDLSQTVSKLEKTIYENNKQYAVELDKLRNENENLNG